MVKIKDPDVIFQKTEQMVKDLSKLHLVRGVDLNCDTSHHGFTPTSIILLTVDAHKEREQEERARAMKTNTTVVDHRKSEKHVPVLDLTLKSMRTFLKCWTFWNEH